MLFLALLCFSKVVAQDLQTSSDTLSVTRTDTVKTLVDTAAITVTDTIITTVKDSVLPPPKKSVIDAVITYQAVDSVVFYANGKGFLYGEGTIDYQNIQLKAEYIEMDMDSSQVFASGVPDSLGVIKGNPVFKEGADAYESRTIKYNFNTKKGYIQHVVTQQGDGYVVSNQTKKTSDDMLYMKDGRYTTCSDHEHPHFYLNLTKAKVKPKSYIVTGPAYLVLEDVPLPLAIPFGYFPFTDSYSSGVIMPSYGDELSRGFFLRDGGYYFAISDYFDFALTGDIYTKGSWALKGASSYVKRYKFKGNFSTSYMVSIYGEKDLPDYSRAEDFNLLWTHSQDPKANLYRTLSANVNFATSSYYHNDVASHNDVNRYSQNTKSSSVSLVQRIPNSPWTFSLTTTVNQQARDTIISLTLPSLDITMSRIYPFKRKEVIGKERWYEKISMSYNGSLSNSITTKEYDFKNASLQKDWKNGVSHKIPISASFPVLKYLTITPSVNYNERWYLYSVDKSWDEFSQQVVADTTFGFRRVFDYNASVSASTKFYGFFKPLPALFGDKINMIRWVITPTVGFSMNPDFGASRYGYWSEYVVVTEDGSSYSVPYSRYEGALYGNAPNGKSGSLNFSLSNNLEMKVKSKKDSVGLKKISLIDNFSLNSSYNLAADSCKWSNISSSLRLKFTDKLGISLNATFDPYMYQLTPLGTPTKVDDYRWNHGKLPQLISTSTSFGYAISNQTFKKKDKEKSTETEKTDESEEESKSLFDAKEETLTIEDSGYAKFEMPWNLRFDYSLRYGRSDFDKEKLQYKLAFYHDLGISGDISLTAKWRLSFSGSYDITNDEITYTSCTITRNLHCWSMSASVVPIGYYTSYTFTIRVDSSLLQDLKYEQRSSSSPQVW